MDELCTENCSVAKYAARLGQRLSASIVFKLPKEVKVERIDDKTIKDMYAFDQ